MNHKKKTKKKALGQMSPVYLQQSNAPPLAPVTRLSVKETIQFSLMGVILVGGALIVGSKMVHKAVSGKEQRETLDEGSIATYAKQIKMAFENDGWWGTNLSQLRDTLRQIPDKKSFNKVMTSYQRLYSNSMLADMQKALKSSEYNEMIAIVSAKPESKGSSTSLEISDFQLQEWAKRLKAAFEHTYGIFPNTDYGAIKAVFLEIPTQSVFEQLKTAYQSLYGNELLSDLKDKLSFWDYDPTMQLIYSKPNS